MKRISIALVWFIALLITGCNSANLASNAGGVEQFRSNQEIKVVLPGALVSDKTMAETNYIVLQNNNRYAIREIKNTLEPQTIGSSGVQLISNGCQTIAPNSKCILALQVKAGAKGAYEFITGTEKESQHFSLMVRSINRIMPVQVFLPTPDSLSGTFPNSALVMVALGTIKEKFNGIKLISNSGVLLNQNVISGNNGNLGSGSLVSILVHLTAINLTDFKSGINQNFKIQLRQLGSQFDKVTKILPDQYSLTWQNEIMQTKNVSNEVINSTPNAEVVRVEGVQNYVTTTASGASSHTIVLHNIGSSLHAQKIWLLGDSVNLQRLFKLVPDNLGSNPCKLDMNESWAIDTQLNPDQACSVNLVYQNTNVVQGNVVLTLKFNNGSETLKSPDSFPFSYVTTQGKAIISFAPAVGLSFNQITKGVGNQIETEAIMVSNSGDDQADISYLINSEGSYGLFNLANQGSTCTNILAAGASCILQVSFGAPNLANIPAGMHNSSLQFTSINHSDLRRSASTYSILLTGSVSNPRQADIQLTNVSATGFTLDSNGVQYGDVANGQDNPLGEPVNATSTATLTLHITNIGAYPATQFTVDTSGISSNYTVVNNSCVGITLQNKESCYVILASNKSAPMENDLDYKDISYSFMDEASNKIERSFNKDQNGVASKYVTIYPPVNLSASLDTQVLNWDSKDSAGNPESTITLTYSYLGGGFHVGDKPVSPDISVFESYLSILNSAPCSITDKISKTCIYTLQVDLNKVWIPVSYTDSANPQGVKINNGQILVTGYQNLSVGLTLDYPFNYTPFKDLGYVTALKGHTSDVDLYTHWSGTNSVTYLVLTPGGENNYGWYMESKPLEKLFHNWINHSNQPNFETIISDETHNNHQFMLAYHYMSDNNYQWYRVQLQCMPHDPNCIQDGGSNDDWNGIKFTNSNTCLQIGAGGHDTGGDHLWLVNDQC